MSPDKLPPIPYESRTNRHLRRRQEDREMVAQAARIAREVGVSTEEAIAAQRAAGDEEELRGIPAIGRGVTGAQPDTRPGHGL